MFHVEHFPYTHIFRKRRVFGLPKVTEPADSMQCENRGLSMKNRFPPTLAPHLARELGLAEELLWGRPLVRLPSPPARKQSPFVRPVLRHFASGGLTLAERLPSFDWTQPASLATLASQQPLELQEIQLLSPSPIPKYCCHPPEDGPQSRATRNNDGLPCRARASRWSDSFVGSSEGAIRSADTVDQSLTQTAVTMRSAHDLGVERTNQAWATRLR